MIKSKPPIAVAALSFWWLILGAFGVWTFYQEWRQGERSPFPIIDLCAVFAGVGIVQMREWGRRLLLFTAVAGIIFAGVQSFLESLLSGPALISFLYYGFYAWYYSRSSVIGCFKNAS